MDSISGVGSKCVFPTTLHKQVMAANCAGWSSEETKALLRIWGASKVQSQLDGIVRNSTIFEKVAAQLREAGYERTWQQCKTKKKMVQRYKKVHKLKAR